VENVHSIYSLASWPRWAIGWKFTIRRATGESTAEFTINHSNDLDPDKYCDTFILFRSPHYALYNEINTPVKLFWSVDQQTQGNYRTDIFPFVDYTITISPYHARYHIGRYGVSPDKITHIDLGVNVKDYQKNIKKIPGRLLYSSVEARGLWHLPNLYRQIKEQRPEASLVITADYTLWGANFTGLEQAPVRFAGLEDVDILGAVPRKELVKQQLQADVLSYPGTYEELFCLAIAEAQVAGAIPVTTDIGAISTTLETGFSSPLRPKTPQYDKWFVDTIVGLLSDRAELERLQKEARQKAIERFSYERIANEWIALIKQLQKGGTIKMAKKQCEWKKQDGERCSRYVKSSEKYCKQHYKMWQATARPEVPVIAPSVPIKHSGSPEPTDLVSRITRRQRIVHLGCQGHMNILENQLSQLPDLPLWTLEETKERIEEWGEAEVVAFLPLNLQRFQELGQVRGWTKEELEDLGFRVEVLQGFHILPEGKVDAAWGIRS